MEFVVAILFCLGDNCDLVRFEPTVTYPSYEACSSATAKKAAELGKLAASQREQGREGDIICLRQIAAMIELDEEREALAAAEVREAPQGAARTIGMVPRGNKVHVTGAIEGSSWLRIALPNGKSGYVVAERMRKLPFDETSAETTVATAAPVPRNTASPPSSPASPPAGQSGNAPPAQQQTAAVPRPPPRPTPNPHEEFRDCEHCPVMVALPAGSFEMGSSNDPTERPVHRVAIAAFAIGKFMVTQDEWRACAAGGGCTYQHEVINERLPMMNLSWDDAKQYVQWLERATGRPYRLPSEAEWEYAARSGTTTNYAWGTQAGVAMANCSGCGGSYDPQLPALVGSFPANAWGLYDMAGGIAEWTEDCWHVSYDKAPANGAAWLSPRCTAHVLRGGSWKNPPKDVMVSTRNYYDTSVRYVTNGVRVALSLGER